LEFRFCDCPESGPYFLSEVDAVVDDGVAAAGALAAGAVELLESDEDLVAESDDELFASPEDFGLALP
jgi:hypothetical protein